MKTEEDDEFERIKMESGWRKRQIMAEDDDDIQVYKKPWRGLTNEEIEYLSQKWRIIYGNWVIEFVEEIETKLKARNT
jgi:hypothetical protein